MQDCPFKTLFHDLGMVFDLVEQITSLRALDENQGRSLPVVHARRFFLYAPKIGQSNITWAILLAEVATMTRRAKVQVLQKAL